MKGQYIQFYKKSDKSCMKMLIEDKGNTSTLDGRLSLPKCCNEAVEICRANNFDGFRIMLKAKVTDKTGTYNTFRLLTDCWKVNKNTIEI